MAGPDVLCIGAAHWDVIGRAAGRLARGDDVPGTVGVSPGGVALNIARALARLGFRPALLAAIGRDAEGEALVAWCARAGIGTAHLCRPEGLPTDRYLAVEDDAGLVAAVADARTLAAAGARILAPLADGTLPAPWRGPVVIDGNLAPAVMAAAAPRLAEADLRLVAASPAKARNLAPLAGLGRAVLYANRAEASAFCGAGFADAREAAEALVSAGAARAIVTDGAGPCADAARGRATATALPPAVAVARVTGAGDRFVAAHLAADRRGLSPDAALAAALSAAAAHVGEPA